MSLSFFLSTYKTNNDEWGIVIMKDFWDDFGIEHSYFVKRRCLVTKTRVDNKLLKNKINSNIAVWKFHTGLLVNI